LLPPSRTYGLHEAGHVTASDLANSLFGVQMYNSESKPVSGSYLQKSGD
jgi:hypothetical protein